MIACPAMRSLSQSLACNPPYCSPSGTSPAAAFSSLTKLYLSAVVCCCYSSSVVSRPASLFETHTQRCLLTVVLSIFTIGGLSLGGFARRSYAYNFRWQHMWQRNEHQQFLEMFTNALNGDEAEVQKIRHCWFFVSKANLDLHQKMEVSSRWLRCFRFYLGPMLFSTAGRRI